MKNTTNIENKTILVTGANRGIGKTITATLLDRGASRVYAAVRRVDTLKPLLEQYGDRVIPLEVDLQDNASIQAAAKRASDVDIVINNAGVLQTTPLLSEGSIDSLKYEQDINVYGLIRIAIAFAPVLKSNGGGAIVQLNSVASIKSFEELATYSASKAASYSITQALRALLEDQGTQVVSVHPGPIVSDMSITAGMDDIAEPPTVVADAIIEALQSGTFHVYPDAVAKQLGSAYQSYAEAIIEPKLVEA
ncbi:SDR family oxidoreductase [Coraliomargarita parva]|uniref:SDR family oxidoreductase n=1 Tax=Coraliomargarita parva TaxID=3014050 RepID=UPI0022B59084|nr:SDR family oxidoreductase [Coraliomargarita parva]